MINWRKFMGYTVESMAVTAPSALAVGRDRKSIHCYHRDWNAEEFTAVS